MFRLTSNACNAKSEALFRLTIKRSLSPDNYKCTWSALSNEYNRSIATPCSESTQSVGILHENKTPYFYTASYFELSEYLFLFVANFMVITKLPLFGKYTVFSAKNNPD